MLVSHVDDPERSVLGAEGGVAAVCLRTGAVESDCAAGSVKGLMSSGSAPMFPFPEEPAVNAVTDGGTQPSGYPLMTSVPSRDPALTSPFQPNPASGGFQPKHWAIVSVLAVIVILVAVLSATIFGRNRPPSPLRTRRPPPLRRSRSMPPRR